MEETNFSSIQEEIDGLELLLSVYDESDSKYIDIEETINGLTELQEIYKVEPITYAPKIVTDGETYSYLTPPSEKYKAKELASFYNVIEDSVEAKRNKRFNTKELKKRLDLIDFELNELKSNSNELSKEVSYGLLWYNASIGLKSLKYDISLYLEYNSNISLDDFLIEFNRMPFEQKKVITIKRRGNFLTNKDEIKLVKSFASKDELRYSMSLINIQDNYAVSTDAFILVGLYDKSLSENEKNYNLADGKLIEDTESKFPNWKLVIPQPRQLTNQIKVDVDSLNYYLSKIIDYGSLAIYDGIDIRFENNTIFNVNLSLFKKTIDYFIKLGYKSIYLNFSDDTNKAIIMTTKEDSDVIYFKQDFALLMPMAYIQSKMYINLDSKEKFEKGGIMENNISSFDKMLQKRRGI